MASEFKVHILGCGSATPSPRHLPSCQVVDHRGRLFMVDCGEGSQLQMMRMKISMHKLNQIFISHLHGDHFLGLPGLLSTMALHGKGSGVTVHCFQEGADYLRAAMQTLCPNVPYDLKFNILDPRGGQTVWEDETLRITTFPLYHRVPAVGFKFEEAPKPRHVNGEMARFHGVPVWFMKSLKEGADFVKEDGTVVPNEQLTLPPTPSSSYAYCTDTMFDRRLVASIRGVRTIYHDSTYADADAADAAPRGHSTARQAGQIAAMAGARELVLGHFSKEDWEAVKEAVVRAVSAAELIVSGETDKAMNEYNAVRHQKGD